MVSWNKTRCKTAPITAAHNLFFARIQKLVTLTNFEAAFKKTFITGNRCNAETATRKRKLIFTYFHHKMWLQVLMGLIER